MSKFVTFPLDKLKNRQNIIAYIDRLKRKQSSVSIRTGDIINISETNSINAGEFFDITDYGASADASDNTTAIQDTLDAATVNGGVVWIPGGTYLTGPLTGYRNVSIWGAGDGVSVLKANAAGTLLDFPYPGSLDPASRFNGILHNFSLDGNSTGATGIAVDTGWNMLFHKVGVENFTGTAMAFQAVLIATLDRCRMEANDIGLSNTSARTIESNLVNIHGCRIVENRWGIYWANGDLLSIDGATEIENNGTGANPSRGGIYYKSHAVQGLHATDVWFEANQGLADIYIDVPDSYGFSILDGCYFFDRVAGLDYGLYVTTSGSKPNRVLVRGSRCNFSPTTAHFAANGIGSEIYLQNSENGTTAETSGGKVYSMAPGTTVVSETSYGQASAVGSLYSWAREDHTHGTPSLSTATPADVASAGAAGAGTTPTKEGHAHKGVHSLAKSGGTALYGDVTISEGANVTITPSGNDLQISAAGSGSGGSSQVHGLARWAAAGGTTFDLPDVAEYIDSVTDAGAVVDPNTYSLSADRTQIVFDSAPTAAHVLTANYVLAVI